MIVQADVLSWCKSYEGDKFHALLCDPPYELGFMGKDWDRTGIAFQSSTWAALAEHLYDGAFIMAFASARGWHRQAVAMEDAGLIMHPSIFGWGYGQGFPKSTNIAVRIDKNAGHPDRGHRIAVASRHHPDGTFEPNGENLPAYEAREDLAKAWIGHRYGLQALKPAVEPILVFQKPYKGKPVECITKTGAGALNIDGARIGIDIISVHGYPGQGNFGVGGKASYSSRDKSELTAPSYCEGQGRWPANLVLSHTPECKRVGVKKVKGDKRDGSIRETTKDGLPLARSWKNTSKRGIAIQGHAPDGTEAIAEWECPEYCPVRRLGEQSGDVTGYKGQLHKKGTGSGFRPSDKADKVTNGFSDSGTAARFFFQADWELENADPIFYTAKSSRAERNYGLDRFYCIKYNVLRNGGMLCEGNMAQVISLLKVISDLAMANLSIAESGDSIMVMFPKDISSIIKTEIGRITESETWNLLMQQPTKDYIMAAFGKRTDGISLAQSAENSKELMTIIGILQEKVGSATTDVKNATYELLLNIKDENVWQTAKSNHPTHKPIKLTQHLATLLLPPKEYAPRRILVPFAGVGSEMIGAMLAGWEEVVGIELSQEYMEIAEARIAYWQQRQLSWDI